MLRTRHVRTTRSAIRSLVVAVLAASGIVVAAPAGTLGADGTPDITLSAATGGETLYGEDVEIVLNAANPTGTDGFNLSFQDVLPPDVAYVPGSSTPEPTVTLRGDGTTALTWTNVSDLLAGTSVSFSYRVRPDTTVYDAGATIATTPQAFVNSDPRFVPEFDADGEPVAGASSFTGSAAAATSTDLVPFRVTKAEPSAESELLRGVHDHQTVYTIRIDNNAVNPTTGLSIVDFVPAGLEFLGCGTVDNTTDAAGAGQEYPGAGVINPGNAPAIGDPCPTPASVTTVTTDPDAGGPLPNAVSTRVEWDTAALTAALGSADLAPGGSFEIGYVAAVPLRQNVQATLTDPTANLDNNTGAPTTDEQALTNHVVATGTYQSTLNPPSVETDDGSSTVVAEDVSIHKSVDDPTFVQGSTSTWTLLVETSEYALSTGPVTVTDTVPDGLDFVSATPTEDGGFPIANGDGTLTLEWTLAGFTGPSETATITFTTTTRADYRATGAPVAANDSWTNHVTTTTDATTITDNDGSTSVVPDTDDASAASQSAGGLAISKEVSEPVAGDLTCGDGSGISWQPTLAGDYRPGDRVCWRLSVSFPGLLDTLDPVVQDYLPPGFAHDSWTVGAADDGLAAGSAFTATSPLLTWDLSDVDIGGLRFEAVVQSTVIDAAAADDGDILSNLMKFRYRNTAGDVFQYRDLADVSWTEPELTLAKGVIDVDDVLANGGSQATGVVAVENGDVVTYEVRIDNAGGEDALDVDVRDTLPPGIDCTAIANISDGGTCDAANTWIDWPSSLNLTVAAGGSLSLTYDLTVPDTTTAATTLTNVAGVRTYEGDTNDPGNPRFTFVPSDNIDPALSASANAGPADDDAQIRTGSPTIAKTRTTGISESGNAAANEATIGETIDYTVTVTLPGGTTYYGPVTITDVLPASLDLVTSTTPTFTRNGGAAAGFTVTPDGAADSVTVTFPLDGDSAYKVANGAPETFVLTFRALVLDDPATDRGDLIGNTGTFGYRTEASAARSISASVNTRVVEPNLAIAKADDDADGVVVAGQSVTYTVTVTNPGDASYTSTAHDLVVVDTVPAELIVLEAPGDPAEDGDTIAPDGGTWDESARTITWSIASLAPDASASVQFEVETTNPLISTGTIDNDAAVEGTSLAGADPNERDNTPVFDGYHAETTNTLTAPSIPVAKVGTPDSRTIGEPVTYTVDLTIPADVVAYDVTLIDDLPAGMSYESLSSVVCDQGGGACSPDIASVDVTTDGDVVSFFIGDLGTAATADRDVTITYVAAVADHVSATAGATLTNTATLLFNLSDTIAGTPGSPPSPGGFDRSSTPATDDTNVVEPSLSVDKDVAGQVGDTDQRRAEPGDTLTFSLTVTNASGATVSDAHDLTIVDTPDTLLTGYQLVAGSTSPGVTTVDGDAADGTLGWSYAGPLAPGASITITYTMDVPADLDESDEVAGGPEATNTADVTSYWGVDGATRTAIPGRAYREYDDVTPDTVEIEVDLASIGDLVWFDVDGDGVVDAGEPTLADVDVTVTYYGADDTFGTADDEAVTVATDAGGNYVVDRLPGGRYRVDVDETDPDLLAGLVPSYDLDGTILSPDGRWDGTLAEDAAKRDVDFGYTGSGSIGDTIWFDHDGDGVQDTGEGGIAGVDVIVTWFGPDGAAGGGDDIVYPAATTDGSGNYLVDLLPAGNFSVAVQAGTLPAGFSLVSDPQGAVDGTALVTLTAGEDDLAQDFGYRGTGSIGDTIYLDRDGDAGQDPDEPGLAGVTVQLEFAGADGTPGNGDDTTLTTTTDATGGYLFEHLPPGDYTVTVTGGLPANVTNSDDPDGGGDSTADLTLADGDSDLDQDFGYDAESVLGDRVWWDLDGDGVQDAGEPGIDGVTVTATGPNGISLTATTSGDGDYLFADIPDGDWTVTVTAGIPTGFSPTYDADGGDDGTSDVTLATSDLGQDFGYAGDSSIGDRLWLDRDGDGVQDAGEPGIEDVTMRLTWFGPDATPGGGDDVVLTTVTDAAGDYLFTGLPAGAYRVEVDEGDADFPDGVSATYDRDDGTVSPDGAAVVTLPAATDLDDVDFGYGGGAALGDVVWFDRDGDGTQDADEPGLAGIDVTAVYFGEDGVFGTADDETFTDTTDTAGVYGFDGLPAGSYRVTVDAADLPTGMLPSYDPDGGLDDTADLVLADGTVDLGQDFGYRGAAEIGDTIWLDLDGNGLRDPGEPGLAGQGVTVTWDGPAGPVVFTTVTDAAGVYGVDGLPDGDYTVTVIGPIAAGATNTADPDGGADSTADTTIAGGVDDLDQDFGYAGANSIGDRVWWDTDADGIQDAGEPGVAGVEVTATWHGADGALGGGDDVAFTATTDAGGAYLFEDLPDGSFTVAVTDGLAAGRDAPTYDEDSGTTSPDLVTTVVGLGTGTASPVAHATADFGVRGTASVGDLVWIDVDGDGIDDGDEPGVAGVTVTVTSAGLDGIAGNADDIVVVVDTDADGKYLVAGLPDGPVTVSYDAGDLGAGFVPHSDRDGGDPTTTSLDLDPGDEVLDVDFGVVGNATLSGVVFDDRDGDGVRDPGEPGIPGVEVRIVWDGPSGPVVRTTTTGPDGGWSYGSVPPGDYEVIMIVDTLPDGDVATTPVSVSVTVPPGGTGSVVHGATASAAVGDRVWHDVDRDGVQDSGEPGLAGVRVTLLDIDRAVVATTTTDATGNYRFENLAPGTYTVTVDTTSVPDGWTQSGDPDGVRDARSVVVLTAGDDVRTIDFGFAAPARDNPVTGTEAGRIAAIAGALLALGAGLVLVTRRRRVVGS